MAMLTSPPPPGPSEALAARQLVLGRLTSAAMHAAVALGVPEALRDSPATTQELAGTLGADGPALLRLLDALVALGVADRHPERRYGLTGLGRALLADAYGSAAPTALLAGGEIGKAWDGLLHSVRTGKPAFVTQTGIDVFSYLAADPTTAATFYSSQAADLQLTLSWLDRFNFAKYTTIVDVGGGDGALLAHVLDRCAAARGILIDTPTTVAAAHERFASTGLSDRTTTVTGDFFRAVPSEGDLYVLRDVLHDWPDERCRDLLAVCKRDMPKTATLLVIDRTIDPTNQSKDCMDEAEVLSHLMDLYMLSVLGGGRERTAAELDELLTGAGFRILERHDQGHATAVEAAPDG
ncbi:methyltransferase [Pseudonocardia sp. EC080610-09]|uniref:methyltransferase n=1 Tax=Pseudonocardia sp. EC080610-09 TaxID=1688404 RepID=UPI000761DFD9|nr:methyltransferase [Pseudonocardia sp. EC080610-09]